VEEIGFTALHGIVDSLWVQRKNASREDYAKLEEPITLATGYDISFEGAYKWIVFLASKQDDFSPVSNRYFGVFEDGTLDRGIETRRRDTPPLFSRFQHQALAIMGQGNTKEVKALMPRVRELFLLYKERLLTGNVPFVDLVFTKSLSKDSDQYSANTVETSAIYQLQDEGDPLRAGEQLQYIISDYRRKNSRKRTVPIELLDEQTTYDAKRYVELLAETCSSITKPFGFVFDTQIGDMKHIV
jgi:DNA polymerase, archaea type